MNCDAYRYEIAADPSFDGGAGHLSECGECQAFRREMQSLDDKIRRAMRLDVPEMTLPDLTGIDETNVVSLDAARPRRRAAWFAIAASVMLAILVGLRMFSVGVTYESLADEVLAHLDHEPMALRPSNTPVSDDQLASVIPASVARLDHRAGLITYARSCKINGKTVPHLVVQGEHGPITILLMPEEAVAEAVSLNGENIRGVILPVGDGSIAIVGAREEKLERLEKSVLESVTWST